MIAPHTFATCDQEKATKNTPHQFVDDDALFQPASELELDYNSLHEHIYKYVQLKAQIDPKTSKVGK